MMKTKNIMKLIALILIVLSALGSTACSGSRESRAEVTAPPEDAAKHSKSDTGEKAAPGSQQNTANVQIQELQAGNLTQSALAHGETMADHHVVYSAEIQGKIEYLGFDLGDEVRKGRTLARIDFQTLKAQSDQAKSTADLAEATYRRLAKLKQDGLISQQQYDEAYSASINTKAQLAIAEANLSKAVIKANHFGIVSKKFVEKSEFVGPGTQLYEVIDYRTIIVEAQLAESQVASVSPGSAVMVQIDALGESFEGTVDKILPTADAMSKTFTARVKIPNPDLRILVGMSARLKIDTENFENVVIAPQNAIIEEQSGARSAFVVNDLKAERREVLLGAHQGGNVIVTSGLKPGDQLIVMGHRDLVDGQPVHVIR
ncbi:MAG: efflux RND transporter periplasmic adaptor subunit [Deltaproteobacteria bacterium]|nr:efflux RND transporter periplasmic adaptor subunit [Deltaproteobacteria bacterium]